MIPRSFNWLALLFAALTLLSVSAESCVAAQTVIEGDQPHALVDQNDHQVFGKVTPLPVAVQFASLDLPRFTIESRLVDRVAWVALAGGQQAPTGIRRHRWLRVERC